MPLSEFNDCTEGDNGPDTTPKTICVLIPHLSSPLIMRMLSGIDRFAAKHRAQIIVMNLSRGNPPEENQSLRALASLADGLIYLPFSTCASAFRTLDTGKPSIVLGSFILGDKHLYVRIDQFDAIYQATTLLLTNGCSHVVLVDSFSTDEDHAKRRAGFLKAHFERDRMPFTEQIIRFPGLAGLPKKLSDYLKGTNPACDGLVLVDRLPDHAELHELRDNGIPAENIFAIEMEAGSGDFQTPAAFNTLSCSYDEIGKLGIELLMKTFCEHNLPALSSIELTARLLPATKPGYCIHAERTVLPAVLSPVNPTGSSRQPGA
jgi:DNA-binding LacI/PurR family transcriptional regulator